MALWLYDRHHTTTSKLEIDMTDKSNRYRPM